jgi:malonyl-CoA/methylmalonyl-CoA synthetase
VSPDPGLCNSCAHQQIVPNTRGSRFSLCKRAKDEPERFRRYPQLPVTACPGFELDLLAGGSLPGAFERCWTPEPLIRDVDGRWLSGTEVDERSAAAAQQFSFGERVMLTAGVDANYLIDYIGVLRAGAIAVPVNPAYTETEIARIRDAAAPQPAGGPVRPPAESEPALLLFTSGTTGAPKGALLTHGNLLASARAVAHAWEWSMEDTLLLTLPLFHMHGLGVGVHGALAAGSRLILRPGFDPADVAERAGEATMFFGVPAMYERLARAGLLGSLKGMRLLVSGSAPLSIVLSDEVTDAAGQRPLERYGMTETVMISGNPLGGPRKPGSVGVAFPGVEIRLGENEEIEVRGPNVLTSYDGGVGADAFTDDGWFRTGDLGEFDEDGYLRISGRLKELIISGGYNVYPREVEDVVGEFPGVIEVAVIGRPSEVWGEQVTAVIVAEGSLDVGALRSFAAERLAPYKVPKAVEIVDALPRNALGKVVRGLL